jgi:hypothetical protein
MVGMSYPKRIYFGDGGEISANFRPADTPPNVGDADAREGDFLHVPQGGLHAFGNDSDAPAEMLLLFTPGAPREQYFEKLSQLGRFTAEERATFLDEHDSYFVD